MKKVYESEEGIKIFLNEKGKYDVVDFSNYFFTIKDVETLSKAKKVAKLAEIPDLSSLEGKYRIINYDEPVKLVFLEGKVFYGKTSPDRTMVEVSGKDVDTKAVVLAHEMGHVETGVMDPTSAAERTAWSWAIPRLVQSGLWTKEVKDHLARNTSLRFFTEQEIAEAKGESPYDVTKETKREAGEVVRNFLDSGY